MLPLQDQRETIAETQRITDEVRREALRAAAADCTVANAVLLDASMQENSQIKEVPKTDDGSNDVLWVNKFAPKHYTHLLSDEVNYFFVDVL